MKISILIPTYQRKIMVCDAISEIIKYDHSSVFEIIVSDNYSDDGTYEHLNKYFGSFKKLRVLRPPIKCGPLQNWQFCLKEARGSHIHWHWSDDLLCAPFYEMAAQRASELGVEVIMGPVCMWYPDNFCPIFYSQLSDRHLDSRTALKHLFTDGRLPYSPAAFILPAESTRTHFYTDIPSVGSLDPNSIAMGADALMIAGSLLNHEKIGFLDRPIIRFRSHEGSITAQNVSNFKNYQVAFEFFQTKFHLDIVSPEIRRRLYGDKICDAFAHAKLQEEILMPKKNASAGLLKKIEHLIKKLFL
jgi:glycosyltransferase involved in cell wall biosynthesis